MWSGDTSSEMLGFVSVVSARFRSSVFVSVSFISFVSFRTFIRFVSFPSFILVLVSFRPLTRPRSSSSSPRFALSSRLTLSFTPLRSPFRPSRLPTCLPAHITSKTRRVRHEVRSLPTGQVSSRPVYLSTLDCRPRVLCSFSSVSCQDRSQEFRLFESSRVANVESSRVELIVQFR